MSLDAILETRQSFDEIESVREEVTSKISVEYGKAGVDTIEYAHDIIIQEIETGFFLGPVLR